MNNSQAKNVISYINQMLDEKISVFEKSNHKFNNKNDYEETFCSLLGTYNNNVKSENFDSIFNAILVKHNITETNLKSLQGKQVKATTIASLKEKVRNVLEKDSIFYNDLINEIAIDINSVLENEESVKNTPYELLTDLNQIRTDAGLSKILNNEDKILNNCYIDDENIIPIFNLSEINSAFEYLKNLIDEKFGLHIDYYDGEKVEINDDTICIPSELQQQTYSSVLQSINIIMAICDKLICKEISLRNYLRFSSDNIQVKNALEVFESMDKKSTLEDYFKQITLLVASENFAKIIFNKEEYAQVTKIFNFAICKRMAYIASELNKQGVIIALSNCIVNNVLKVYDKFGLTLENVKTINNNLGLRTTNESQILSLESLILAEQEFLLNFDNQNISDAVEINKDKLSEEQFYHQYYKTHFDQMQHILSVNIKNVDSAEDLTNAVLNIKNRLNEANGLIDNHNHFSNEQMIACLDLFSLINSAKDIVSEVEKELALNLSNVEDDTQNINNTAKESASKNSSFGFSAVNPVNINTNSFVDSDNKVIDDVEEDTNNDNANIDNSNQDTNVNVVNDTNSDNTSNNNSDNEDNSVIDLVDENNNSNDNANNNDNVEVVVQEDDNSDNNKEDNSELINQIKENELLNEQITQKDAKLSDLQRQIDELKAKLLEQQNSINNNKPKPVVKNIYTVMQDKIIVTTQNSLKSVVASLMSANKDEISDKIIFANNRCDSIKGLIASLNLLYNVEGGPSSIRSTLVAMNSEQTVKNLMLLKSSFEKIFVASLAKKLGEEAVDQGLTNLSGVELIKKVLSSTKNKFSVNLKKSYKREIGNLISTYDDPDSFEYQEEMDKVKAKYYGEGSKVGLFDKLNDIMMDLILKDVIVTELKKIAECEKNGQKYSFNEAKAQEIVDSIFLEDKNQDVDTMEF